jgi:hypothetical protein
MEVGGQFHSLAALPPGEEPLVPTEKEAGWTQELVWTQWWRENFPVPAKSQNPDPQCYTNDLSRIYNFTFTLLNMEHLN